MSKYNEYRQKAQTLDKLIATITSDHISVDTVDLTDEYGVIVRIARESFREAFLLTVTRKR